MARHRNAVWLMLGLVVLGQVAAQEPRYADVPRLGGGNARPQPAATTPAQRQNVATPAGVADIKPIYTPADAVRLAVTDLATLPADAHPFTRYFFTLDNSKEFHSAFAYVLNSCVSHASTLYRPTVLADGHLIRCDMRRLWPRKADYEALLPEFEKLAQLDPYFHTIGELVIQEQTGETKRVTKQVKVKVQPYRARDGQIYDYKWQTQTVDEPVVKEVRKFGSEHALHLLGTAKDEAPITLLAKATVSSVPIMRADQFLFLVSSTVEEENGKYYTFRRISKSSDGKTAEQLWLESIGVDLKTVEKLRADQRIGKWRSGITAKPRAIEYFFATSARPSVGPAGVAITRDVFIGKVPADQHPIKNLLGYKFDGSEAMGFLPNGMMTFVLFDGQGELAATAPDKLVSDRTVPSPHQTILQAPISCWRCHGSTDMWMDASNDVYALSRGKLGLNIFDDLSSKDDAESTLDRLVGLYAGEMDEFLRVSRNTHAKATFIVTNGQDIPTVAKKIGEVYGRYRYNAVTPQVACRELGWLVSEDKAVALLNKILPPLPPNRLGVRPESVTIGTLRAWTPRNKLHVNRDDWEQEYADAMLRVTTEAIRQQAQGAK